jgi:recombination protein RecT
MSDPKTQMVKTQDVFTTVRSALVHPNMAKQIRDALPKHVSQERMVRVFLTSMRKNPKLLECSQESLMASMMTAAQLGLEPDGIMGQGYLIPRYSSTTKQQECSFQPGYQGLLDIARRSGQISTIHAACVFEGDLFEYGHELDRDVFIHRPANKTTDADKITYVWAMARMKDGGVQFTVLPRIRIEQARLKSQKPTGSFWNEHYEPMAIKTALIRLCKYLPRSIELARALEAEETGESPEPMPELIEAPPPDPTPLARLTEALAVDPPTT